LFFSLGVPCILPVYFGLRPFAPFLIYFTYKKKGSPKSGFLCMDGDFRKNSNFGQFTKEEYYCDGVVLYV